MNILQKRLLFSPQRQSRLPNGYQEVEYIENSGLSYIDTGYIPNSDTSVEMTGRAVELKSGNNQIYNGRGNGKYYGLSIHEGNPSINIYYNTSWHTAVNSNVRATPYDFYVYQCENYITIKMDGEYWQNVLSDTYNQYRYANYTEFNGTYSIYIFGADNAGALYEPVKIFRLYSFAVWDNNVKIRDFVPCYRRSDGEIGLYDLCGSVCSLTGTPFYINAGTGTFLKGEDV